MAAGVPNVPPNPHTQPNPLHPGAVPGLLVDDDFEDVVDDSGEALEGVLDAEEYMGELDEDILIASAPADELGVVLGTLEDVMMDEGFNERIDEFMRTHCALFDSAEENKHEYMALFTEYMALLERYIQAKMEAALPGFDMAGFCALIKESGADINVDLEALGAYGDFQAFKEMMVSYREEIRLDSRLSLTGAAVHIYTEEDEDGLPMPELTLSISSPIRLRAAHE